MRTTSGQPVDGEAPPGSGASIHPSSLSGVRWWRVALTAVTGLSLYLLLPSLAAVFGSWRSLAHLSWPFTVLTLGCEVGSFVCLWQLERIVLRTRRWLPVIAAQLSGTALGHFLPSAALLFLIAVVTASLDSEVPLTLAARRAAGAFSLANLATASRNRPPIWSKIAARGSGTPDAPSGTTPPDRPPAGSARTR
jgi:hypothetical protein